jgi:hypothetical protein
MAPTSRLSWLLALAVVAAAAPSRPAVAQEIALSPNLANNLRYLHVGMASGRVRAVSQFPGRSLNSSTESQDRREKLTIDLNGAAPSIDYELSTSGFQVVLNLDDGNTLRIRRIPQGEGKTKYLEFHQPAEGPISVTIGQNPPEKTYTADSLWHLLVAEPDMSRTEVEPLLRLMRPGWPLASEGQAIEQSLFKQVDVERNYDRQAWAELVNQLRSENYADRIEADRRLRELGQVVVPYLRNLATARLDAEQAYRIRMIVRRFGAGADEDTPDNAASWLAADPEVWYSLAVRTTGKQRAKVRTQLALILGEPVVFDVDASGDALKAQLGKIREQINRLRETQSKAQ